jgi:hypothetical protein
MNILRDVLNALRNMFVADGRLALGITALIAVVATLAGVLRVMPWVAGAVLLVGCVAILIETAVHRARSEASR